MGGDAHAHRALERIGLKRDVQQIGQEAPLGLPVRMAHLMPDDAPLIRDRAERGAYGDPGSAAHHFAMRCAREMLRGCV
jgi:hypothetical protein